MKIGDVISDLKPMFRSAVLLLWTVLCTNLKLIAQLKPGDLADNVIYLDADELGPFRQGYAIIKKGIATGVINSTGAFVVPYQKVLEIGIGKARFGSGSFIDSAMSSGPDGFINGFCVFYDKAKKKHGFYDRQMRMIYTEYPIYNNFMPNGYAPLWGGGYIDSFGKKGQPRISAADKEIASSKLTAVQKEDFFGKKRWGFADSKGNMVIPESYDMMPGNFSEGLSLVRIVNKDKNWEYNYSYIDKSGITRINILKGSPEWPYNEGVPLREPGTFVHGLSFWANGYGFHDEKGFWITPDGQMLSYNQLLDKYHAKFTLENVEFKNIYGNYLCFKGRLKANSRGSTGYAVINVVTGETLEGPFVDVKFDDDAGLALQNVEYLTAASNWIKISGYINKEGIFMIVKKD